jgi:hypothetical protein
MALPKQRQEAPAGNTSVIELVVRLSTTGAYVNNAVGTVSVIDETDESLVGSVLGAVYVAASNGVYRAVAPSNTFEVGVKYRCDVVLDDAATSSHFEGEVWAFGVKPDILPP